MSDRTPTHTGGCQCGAIRFAFYTEPTAGLCHCRMCQKAAGGPFWAWASIGMTEFAWTAAQPAWFRSSSAARRCFCPRCGTPLGFQWDRRANEIDLGIATLDDPANVRPTKVVGIESRLPWCDASLFDLPSYRTGELNPPEDLTKIQIFQHPDRPA
jgi:hypothetical protein